MEGELAEMDANLAEASKIRTEEHNDYVKASSDFSDSAKAVAAATQVLKSYYEGSFIQLSAKTTLKSKSKQPTCVQGMTGWAESSPSGPLTTPARI